MVSMAVATLSVIESVIVISICSLGDNGTQIPSTIRFIAFRVLGRALRVSCPSCEVSPEAAAPVVGRSSPVTTAQLRASRIAHWRASLANPQTATDELLTELRKVEVFYF